jgi:DNA-directed RNA polymerase specialized sigma24 family protein
MSSAARVAGPAAACARALREAGDDPSWRDARDALAGELRAQAIRVLGVSGVPAQAREDLAQAVTLSVLERIVRGAVAPGFEDGYIAVAARNRARDWHREESGVHEKMAVLEEDAVAAPGPDPCSVLELAEADARLRQLADRVARVLESAPPRYRDALVAVYLEGVPIDALVEREIFGEWPWAADGTRGDDPVATRRRARARVDKLHQRARDWVRARLTPDAPAPDAPVRAETRFPSSAPSSPSTPGQPR